MTRRRRPRLQPGWRQATWSFLVALSAAGVIASATWRESQTAGRLAFTALALLLVALVAGSKRLVAFTSFPLLGAALITVVGTEDTLWVRALVVGVFWYVSAELAWEAIERRDGVRRTRQFNGRRIDEISNVVLASMAITAAAFTLSNLAPSRNTVVLGASLAIIIAALGALTRQVREAHGGTEDA